MVTVNEDLVPSVDTGYLVQQDWAFLKEVRPAVTLCENLLQQISSGA